MDDAKAYIERQAQAVAASVPWEFYDALGPYEGQAFEKTLVTIKDAGLGWLIIDVSLIYIDNNDQSRQSLILGILPMTIWPSVKCSWDPEELDSLSRNGKLQSLDFDISNDIEFDSVDINTPEDRYSLYEELAQFALDIINDEHDDATAADPRSFASLIDQLPKPLQKIIRQKFA